MVDLLLYLKCFSLHVANTPPVQRGSRAEGSTHPRDLPSVPFQCRMPSMEGIAEPAIADTASLSPSSILVSPSPCSAAQVSPEAGSQLGWDEQDPDPRNCCQCSGWAGQAGDISWGQGGCTAAEGTGQSRSTEGPGIQQRRYLGQDRGMRQGGGWGSALG